MKNYIYNRGELIGIPVNDTNLPLEFFEKEINADAHCFNITEDGVFQYVNSFDDEIIKMNVNAGDMLMILTSYSFDSKKIIYAEIIDKELGDKINNFLESIRKKYKENCLRNDSETCCNSAN